MSPERPHPNQNEIAHSGRVMLRNFSIYVDRPNLARALKETSQDKKPYMARVKEFHKVCDAFNSIITDTKSPGEGYLRASGVRNVLEKKPFPTPVGAIASKDESILLFAERAFDQTAQKIKLGEWEFANTQNDPGILTSGLMIEGYGLFLAELYNKPELAQDFVLGFEEVLWNEFQGCQMLHDVLPWMIDDREKFSAKVRKGLDALDPKENERLRKQEVMGKAPFLKTLLSEKQQQEQREKSLTELSKPIEDEIMEGLGEDWQVSVLEGARAKTTSVIFRDGVTEDVSDRVLLSLVYAGYETGNERDLELFKEEFVEKIKDLIDMKTLERRGVNVAEELFKTVRMGVDLRDILNSIENENPRVVTTRAPDGLAVWREGLKGIDLDL